MKPSAEHSSMLAEPRESEGSAEPEARQRDLTKGAQGQPEIDASRGLEFGRRVLAREISGLQDLAKSLDESFVKALDVLASLKGRAIITGMGKSGHVARKIAATLASTGTPAQFVHPGEASHGDLGMIARDDAVLALSNSGNTTELTDIVSYTRRFSMRWPRRRMSP